MTHDPFCPCAPIDPIRPGAVHTANSAACLCVLIAKVRADERQRTIGVMERNADGDAMKVIDAVLDMTGQNRTENGAGVTCHRGCRDGLIRVLSTDGDDTEVDICPCQR